MTAYTYLSAGLLTPLTTPRGRPESAAAALPAEALNAAGAATPPPQRAQQAQQPQAAQQVGEAAEALLGAPLWSPMLPAGAAHSAPLGAGLLGTLRKAARNSDSPAVASASSGPAAEAATAAGPAAQRGAALPQEANCGEPAGECNSLHPGCWCMNELQCRRNLLCSLCAAGSVVLRAVQWQLR